MQNLPVGGTKSFKLNHGSYCADLFQHIVQFRPGLINHNKCREFLQNSQIQIAVDIPLPCFIATLLEHFYLRGILLNFFHQELTYAVLAFIKAGGKSQQLNTNMLEGVVRDNLILNDIKLWGHNICEIQQICIRDTDYFSTFYLFLDF